jgi:hypothetical protein
MSKLKREIRVFVKLLAIFSAAMTVMACATSPVETASSERAMAMPRLTETPDAPATAGCRIYISVEDPLELDECVESVTSDGTLILRPSTMKRIESQLTKETPMKQSKQLWMMLANEKSANAVFGGPVVAYIGKGPSGANLARQVAFFDNGPDYFSEGLARSIAKNGKVGFIDETLTTVIREEYDFATPYRKGLALACNGCRADDLRNEHSTVVGGDWLVLNKFGKVLKGPGLTQVEAYNAVEALTRKVPRAAKSFSAPTPNAKPSSKEDRP